ncbi:hypothetical protein CR155_00030 [Pollutimonas nitritireducens]|uniref:Glycosyltransferase RgtA/B/C/D-like domain-containing protein n=1 Tax=Pollutimonas nitritireducens TaxID=2045209 RepID=A0A2N4UKC7_9BURK|nr:hypothetical protein [Pollutimonas nitritireducens]PLC55487.1 hypothetical protein CR155_00030 [Pollutimonas nitritireducens]
MLIDLIRVHAIASAFLLHCAVVGFALLKPMDLWESGNAANSNRYLKWFFAISIGCLGNIAVLFALGMAGWFSFPAIMGLSLAMLLAALPLTTKQIRELQIFSGVPRGQVMLDALILLTLLFTVLIVAFHPPGHWDDTMYHLPLARDTLRHQGIVLNEYLRFPLFPQNINLLLALGLMLRGDVMAQAFASIPLFVMGLGLMGAARWIMGSPLAGAIATVVLFTLGPIKSPLGYAYIDNGLAMFCWAAMLALALWASKGKERRSYNWLIVAGLLAGGAAGSKYFGGVFAVLLGSYLLIVRRDWKASAAYGAAVLAAGSWWYIRSFVVSGDPLHPAGGEVFGYFLWNAEDLLRQQSEQAMHGVSSNPLYLWASLKEANVVAWALAFAGLVFRNTPTPVRALQFTFLAYFIFWFFVTQVTRYLAPISAVGTFLSFYTLYRCYALVSAKTRAKWIRNRGAVASYLLLALLTSYAGNRYHKYHGEMAEWNAILAKEPGYQLFSKANTLIPTYGPRLVQLGFENAVYFFDGTVIGDWFGRGRYSSMLDCRVGQCKPVDAKLMRQQMMKFGSRMLAISTEQYSDFERVDYEEDFDLVIESEDGMLLYINNWEAPNSN